MTELHYLLLFIAVMAAATFMTRILPFILLYKVSEHPILLHLGRYLPPVMMVLLLFYCFRDIRFSSINDGAAEVVALVVVITLHLWRKNALLSIIAGTGVYMFLAQSVILAS